MEAEGVRNGFGGEDLRTFFQHPAVKRIRQFIDDTLHPFGARYQLLLVSRVEKILDRENVVEVLQAQQAIVAMTMLLTEMVPFEVIKDMQVEAFAITNIWMDQRCPKKSDAEDPS